MNINDEITLLHGDCLAEADKIEPHSVDLAIADIPYGVTHNKWDSVIPFEPMWDMLHRVVKDNSAIVLFSQMPFTLDLGNSNRKEFRYEIIWQKPNPRGFFNANRMPLKVHENILVFYKSLPKYHPQKTEGKLYVKKRSKSQSSNYGAFEEQDKKCDGGRFPIDIIKINNIIRGGYLHPTQKPVELMNWFIKTYSDPGDTVLDFSMGSGTTGISCIDLGRKFIGIEKDDDIFESAYKRIEEHCKCRQLTLPMEP